jgi:hypothetical protein
MKKIFIPVLCLLLALLCACGKSPAPTAETTDVSAEESSKSAATESVTWDDGDFRFLKGDKLPEGWTVNDTFSTSTYLQAEYGEGESAPRLTVSVMTYNDEMGADKAKLLADKVFDREKDNATAVETLKIGGLDFYSLSYNSLLTEKTRCHVFYGQTVPAKNKEYKFIEIQLDNVKDDKQYDALKGVLDTLSFKF